MKNELSKKTYLFIVSNVLKRTLALVALLHSPFFTLHSSLFTLHSPLSNLDRILRSSQS